jgi:glycine/D-amino acid oxidase-like deaminating enzyme
VWRRSRAVVAALAERTTRLGIDADMTARDGLYLSGELLDAKALQREAIARRRIGLEVELLGRSQLRNEYGLGHAAALRSAGDFVADPRKLAAGYLRAACGRSARILSPVEITSVQENRLGVSASTRQGHMLRARWAIFCTGYEVATGLRARGHSIQSTWVIATRPQRRALWPTECMIWEASLPYLYLRTTSDGRVICGGADEEFSDAARRDSRSAQKYRYLERRLHKLLPELDCHADTAWSGTFGASKLGLPIIGRIPGTRRQLTVLGCGGNGITFSMLAAQILSSTILGYEDSDADLFTPRRE